MPAPCTVFTTRPKARKDTPSPAFSFGRVLDELAKCRNSTDYAEKNDICPRFRAFLACFWPRFGRIRAKSQRMQQSSRNSPPRLPTLKHETPRVVSVVETHAAGLRYGRNRGGAFAHLLVSFFLPKGKPNVHHLVTNTLPNKANRRGQSTPRGLSRRIKRAAAPQRNDRKPTKR